MLLVYPEQRLQQRLYLNMSLNEKALTSEMEKGLPGDSSPAPSAADITDEWTEADEKKLRNRLDWHIVPFVTVLYLMCFLDRFVAHIKKSRTFFAALY